MRTLFKSHPLEVVAGIAGVVITALGLALSRQPDWPGLFGTILSIVGATLAAVVSASVFGSQRANENTLARLEILRNQLATSSSQISGALSAHLFRGESVETTLSRVDQGVGSISSVLRDMGDVLGGASLHIDSEAIIQSKRDVVDLGQALDALKSQVEETPDYGEESETGAETRFISAIEEMQAKVSDVLTALSRAEKSVPEREMLAESVTCPNCGTANSLVLGSIVGDSQTPLCANCGERFHAHRGSAGVFTNRGSTGVPKPASLLSRHSMRLPSHEERRRYLTIIDESYRDGTVHVARDLTNVIDQNIGSSLPSNVRMPLFYSLVNRDYGVVRLEEDETKPMRELSVVRFHDCEDDDEFVDHAEAAWLAQALYRLWGYHLPEEEINDLLFNSHVLTSQQTELLERARRFARSAIDHRPQPPQDPSAA